MTVNVLCMKWGTKFGPVYVNRLHAMVRRNLARQHRFVCLTDDTQGLDQGIETLPLPDVGWTEGVDVHGWRKVGLFSATLGDLTGQALFLDLDVVIVDALDPLFDHPGEVVAIVDYALFNRRPRRRIANTSVLRFPIGAYPEVVETFRRDFPSIARRVRNEQEYLSHHFLDMGLLEYWPRAWCPSFKWDCVAPGPMSYLRTPRLPGGARVVVFHGRPNPEEAIEGRGGKFYRAILPTPWIADYWQDGG